MSVLLTRDLRGAPAALDLAAGFMRRGEKLGRVEGLHSTLQEQAKPGQTGRP
jgi:hypothetical protein